MKSEEKKGKKPYQKVLSIVSWVLLAIAVIALFYVLFARIRGKSPTLFGYSFYIVETDSMTPEIKVDDLVVAVETPIEEIEVGDDVVFISNNANTRGNRIVHRVVEANFAETGYIITQGIKTNSDGTPAGGRDAPINAILGKVVSVSTGWGKFFAFFVRNPQAIYAILLAVLVVFIVIQALNVISLSRKAKLENEILSRETAKAEALRESTPESSTENSSETPENTFPESPESPESPEIPNDPETPDNPETPESPEKTNLSESPEKEDKD